MRLFRIRHIPDYVADCFAEVSPFARVQRDKARGCHKLFLLNSVLYVKDEHVKIDILLEYLFREVFYEAIRNKQLYFALHQSE